MEPNDARDHHGMNARRTSDPLFEGDDADEYRNRPHKCVTCEKRFTLLENLNRHQMIHTDERPFPCTYCHKRFRLAQHLKEHIRIHTGEKPYKCSTCGRAFCQISNLKSHEKTHTKIKAFKCDICQKCFRRAFTLKQHKLTHSRRAFQGNIQAENYKDVQSSGYYSAARKQSLPHPFLEFSNHDLHRRHSLNETDSNQSSRGLFSKPSMGGSMRPLTVSSPPRSLISRVPPNSAPSRTGAPFVSTSVPDDHRPSQKPSEVSQCPSLSALLRTDCDALLPSLKDHQPATYSGPNYYHSSVTNSQRASPRPLTNSHTIIPRRECVLGNSSANDHACVQCDGCFSNEADLRNHTIREHSRKNQRRDSAYSSHSEKSPSASPHFGQVGGHAVDDASTQSRAKSQYTEAAFMQRVKELALISLGRYGGAREPDANRSCVKRSATDDQNDGESQQEIPIEVGHSPTESRDETKSIDDASEKRGEECKVIRRGFHGSKKWKREICKEWYDVPEKRTSTDTDSKAISCDEVAACNPVQDPTCESSRDCNARETTESAIQNESKNDEKNPTDDATNSTTFPTTTGYQRFAPIVELKPVVTGWRDMLLGTIYAFPPQGQQGYVQSLYDPLVVIPKPPDGSVETADDSCRMTEDDIRHLDAQSSPRYFRFSPHILANFATEGDSISSGSSDSAQSGVYSYPYPPENLPIAGYSRLQHALLHNWDSNRNRLGGTSSVPQTPSNLVPAT